MTGETDGLALHGVWVHRGGRAVLQNVSATLRPGQVVGLVGPNGAGKSTLLNAIAGELAHLGGIAWNGRAVTKAELAFMPQAVPIRSTLSVLEAVLLGRLERLGWQVQDEDILAASRAMERLQIAHLADRKLFTLSGGQQQMVLLAQRLVRQPKLLLLDEPTSALDLRRQLVVLEILSSYAREADALVIVALHDLSLAARYASMLLLMKDGELVEAGAPSSVLNAASIAEAYEVEAETLMTHVGFPVIAPIRAFDVRSPAFA